MSHRTWASLVAFMMLLLFGCSQPDQQPDGVPLGEFTGEIRVAGPSAVSRVTRPVVDGFVEEAPQVEIAVSDATDEQGLALLCNGLIEIAQTTRKITSEESAVCESNRFLAVELEVAASAAAKDGLTRPRPLYIYVNRANAQGLGGSAVPAFVDFYLADLGTWVEGAGYEPLSEDRASVTRERWAEAKGTTD
jgi:ABC-type phosphate transport system substrate-binding protein